MTSLAERLAALNALESALTHPTANTANTDTIEKEEAR